jgi:mono/diheme cytochrome c family protein
MPRWLIWTAAVAVVLSWIPLALIARARVVTSPRPRIHIIPDMDNQQRFKAQQANPMFADGRAMRPPVEGAVARDGLAADDALYRGRQGDGWVERSPVQVSMSLLERGRDRYDVFCAPCHGLAGLGDGIVAKRAEALQEGTWTPPSSFHTDLVRGRPDGHLFNTITNGIRNMPAYGPQIPVHDRWAVVAYVRALQRSQNATLDDVPADTREQLVAGAAQ